MVNLINIFVKNKNLSYSNLGKARSYSYDGLGNRMGIKEYERKISYGKDGLKTIFGANLSELTPSYEENYILDRTRVYHNLLQRRTGKRGVQAIQSYVWDFNVAYMEEGEKEFTYLQDELGSTIRLLGQGEESQTIYGYDEFGEDTYGTQGHLQPFSLNQYGYCLGNPLTLIDCNGKTAREHVEDNILQNKNGSPYVGVFYLNIESGAFGNGHAAMMLLRRDDKGDLYSFIGDANSPLSIFC